jgi:transcriptional antiterminator RfaH
MPALVESYPLPYQGPLPLAAQERWYVVRTQPHRETRAARQLENQSFRVFLPRFLKSRRHARKFETILAPLFPRYMFIVLDLHRDRWRSVNGTLGVDRLLMRAGEPETVPYGLVEELITAATDGVVSCGPPLKEGQNIRVTAGPFAEIIGTLDKLDDQGRVRALLDILGGKIPVILSRTLVAPSEST